MIELAWSRMGWHTRVDEGLTTHPLSPIILDEPLAYVPRWQNSKQSPNLIRLKVREVQQFVQGR
jgi:hypothetical protein